jgi:hypothetical protein
VRDVAWPAKVQVLIRRHGALHGAWQGGREEAPVAAEAARQRPRSLEVIGRKKKEEEEEARNNAADLNATRRTWFRGPDRRPANGKEYEQTPHNWGLK